MVGNTADEHFSEVTAPLAAQHDQRVVAPFDHLPRREDVGSLRRHVQFRICHIWPVCSRGIAQTTSEYESAQSGQGSNIYTSTWIKSPIVEQARVGRAQARRERPGG